MRTTERGWRCGDREGSGIVNRPRKRSARLIKDDVLASMGAPLDDSSARDDGPYLVVVRESDDSQAAQMRGLLQDIVHHCETRQPIANGQDLLGLGVKPFNDPDSYGGGRFKGASGAAPKGGLWRIGDTWVFFWLGTAAGSDEDGLNDFTVHLASTITSIKPRRLYMAVFSRMVRSLEHQEMLWKAIKEVGVESYHEKNDQIFFNQEDAHARWLNLAARSEQERVEGRARLRRNDASHVRENRFPYPGGRMALGWARDTSGHVIYVGPTDSLRQLIAILADPDLTARQLADAILTLRIGNSNMSPLGVWSFIPKKRGVKNPPAKRWAAWAASKNTHLTLFGMSEAWEHNRWTLRERLESGWDLVPDQNKRQDSEGVWWQITKSVLPPSPTLGTADEFERIRTNGRLWGALNTRPGTSDGRRILIDGPTNPVMGNFRLVSGTQPVNGVRQTVMLRAAEDLPHLGLARGDWAGTLVHPRLRTAVAEAIYTLATTGAEPQNRTDNAFGAIDVLARIGGASLIDFRERHVAPALERLWQAATSPEGWQAGLAREAATSSSPDQVPAVVNGDLIAGVIVALESGEPLTGKDVSLIDALVTNRRWTIEGHDAILTFDFLTTGSSGGLRFKDLALRLSIDHESKPVAEAALDADARQWMTEDTGFLDIGVPNRAKRRQRVVKVILDHVQAPHDKTVTPNLARLIGWHPLTEARSTFWSQTSGTLQGGAADPWQTRVLKTYTNPSLDWPPNVGWLRPDRVGDEVWTKIAPILTTGPSTADALITAVLDDDGEHAARGRINRLIGYGDLTCSPSKKISTDKESWATTVISAHRCATSGCPGYQTILLRVPENPAGRLCHQCLRTPDKPAVRFPEAYRDLDIAHIRALSGFDSEKDRRLPPPADDNDFTFDEPAARAAAIRLIAHGATRRKVHSWDLTLDCTHTPHWRERSAGLKSPWHVLRQKVGDEQAKSLISQAEFAFSELIGLDPEVDDPGLLLAGHSSDWLRRATNQGIDVEANNVVDSIRLKVVAAERLGDPDLALSRLPDSSRKQGGTSRHTSASRRISAAARNADTTQERHLRTVGRVGFEPTTCRIMSPLL